MEFGLDEGATEFDGVGEVVFDELVGVVEELRGRGGDGTVVLAQHVAAMDEAIAANNFFVFGTPDKELFETVGFGKSVELVDVAVFSCATTVEGVAQFAKAANFAHDVGRKVGSGDVDFFVAAIGFAEEIFVFEFCFDEFAGYAWDDVGGIDFHGEEFFLGDEIK